MSGSLPFMGTCEVQDNSGALLYEDVPISIWSVAGRTTSVGQAYDHEAEASLDAWDALSGSNRVLVADGVRYRVVEAVKYEMIPHIALVLRRINPGGGSA